MVTIFKNIFSKEPHYVNVSECLQRIKEGKSAAIVSEIRNKIDKERANELKKNLPSICFSGKFDGSRKDASLIEHSGFIILDFDKLECPDETKKEVFEHEFVEAVWISPSGTGVKALCRIADGSKHKEHFQALQEVFPEIDKSGINPSRVCYESHDSEIFIKTSKPFTKVKTYQTFTETKPTEDKVFEKILKWLSNRGDAFRTGERNLFLFKLASACCRFGIHESETLSNFNTSFLFNANDFSSKEVEQTIRSAYRSNNALFGNAQFVNEKIVTKGTTEEIKIDTSSFESERLKDVIFGEDVKAEALEIYRNGYKSANSTHIPELDYFFKWKRREITLLSGIGNFGKSTFLKYLLLMQVIVEGKKYALFSPEDNPAAEFYHDLVEIYFGANCAGDVMLNRPSLNEYERIYDWISKHIFYVYPKDISPTPDYIKEVFLELIIKEQVDGCIIDPFNQMTNDYSKTGGRDDKYLETVLADFARFAQKNDIYFLIVAHPKAMRKQDDGNYPCPDVFDLAGGAMWNNKMDNILIYHRPEKGSNPNSTLCEFHSKKIRRQKIVGLPGTLLLELSPRFRRFFVNGKDYMQLAIDKTTQYNVNKFPDEAPF